MNDEAILQEKITEIKQQLNEMKTSQWGREDSWTPYQYELSTVIQPSSGRVYPAKYYKIDFISPVKKPTIFFFYYGTNFPYTETATYSWGTEVIEHTGTMYPYYNYLGSDFEPTWYISYRGVDLTNKSYSSYSVSYTNIGTYTVLFRLFSSQPGELKLTEISESEYKQHAI